MTFSGGFYGKIIGSNTEIFNMKFKEKVAEFFFLISWWMFDWTERLNFILIGIGYISNLLYEFHLSLHCEG